MTRIISISAVSVLLLLVNFFIYQSLPLKDDVSELKRDIDRREQQSKKETNPLELEEPDVADYHSLVEIVITPDDIKQSAIGATLGVVNPFNSQYISKDDIKESIVKIMGENFSLESLDVTLQDYVVSLRNMEMLQGLKEDKSQVKFAIEQYAETGSTSGLGNISTSGTQVTDGSKDADKQTTETTNKETANNTSSSNS